MCALSYGISVGGFFVFTIRVNPDLRMALGLTHGRKGFFHPEENALRKSWELRLGDDGLKRFMSNGNVYEVMARSDNGLR